MPSPSMNMPSLATAATECKPSPLRNMPPLAAAATECRLFGQGRTSREINLSKDQKCTLRVHGDLIVGYRLRAVGGGPKMTFLHKEHPRKFDKLFELENPDLFFLSYTLCREDIHKKLKQTPLLREFDLAPDNWDDFMPHNLATAIVDVFRRDTYEHGGVALRFNINVFLTISVYIVYSEPKALLLACKEAAAVSRQWQFMAMPAECCICMDDFAANKDSAGVVALPCSHSFHRRCIAPWFYKVATCPMCRHDMGEYLVAFTGTLMGKFPGLGA